MNKIVALLLFVFLLSCDNDEKKQEISFAPKVTEAKGYTIPNDSVQEPKKILAGVPITIKAGTPKVNPTNLNVHTAGQPKIIVAGLSKINTPGTDTFLLPKTRITKGKTKPAGIPEVTIAKDAGAKDVNPANFSFYKTLQGLKNNNIRCMLQDKTGNLWLGTDGGGVCRYDGKYFTKFTDKEGLSNNLVLSILEDKGGNLWFGTYGGGVCRYDGKSFTNFTIEEGLSNNIVWRILEDKTGNLWFATDGGGVCSYNGNRVDDILNGTNLYLHAPQDLKRNKKDLVKSFTIFNTKAGLSNDVVLSILEDKAGNLWFGTSGGGVCRYNGNCVNDIINGTNLYQHTQLQPKKSKKDLVKSFTIFAEKDGLLNNSVNEIIEDITGNLWFGTDGGVSCYNGNYVDDIINGTNLYKHKQKDLQKNKKDLVKTFTNLTKNEGLSNNVVYAIFADETGNLWFGTAGGGVSIYNGNSVDDLIDGTGLYLHAQQDLKKNKKDLVKSFTTFTEKDGISNNFVISILGDKTGNLWLGTYGGGACRYDGKSFTNITEKEGLSENIVYAILEDKAGNIWFGTEGGGVCCYDGQSFTNYSVKNGLSAKLIFSILEDKSGNLWFGTSGGGVCRYNGNCVDDIINGTNLYQHSQKDLQKNKKELVKSFTNFTEKEGLPNNVVNAIVEDKSGNLWFGTCGGVSRYNGNCIDDIINGTNLYPHTEQDLKKNKKDLIKSFTNFTKKEGLSNNTVFSILEDKIGNLWFGTDGGGVCLYNGNCVDDIINGTNLYQHAQSDLKSNKKKFKTFTNFTEKDGLSNNVVNAILEDNTGNIWLGTPGGASRYNGNCVEDVGIGTNLLEPPIKHTKGNKKDLVKSIMSFTEKEGLVDNAVLNMVQDVDGNIWFGTNKGLSKAARLQLKKLEEKNENFNPIKEAFFYNYVYNDGFLGVNCRRNSVLQDSKGKIWWGADVLTRYDPKGSFVDTTAPEVNLTKLKLFGEEITWANLNAVYSDSAGKEIIKVKTNGTLLSNGILLKDIKFDGLTKWFNLPEHLSLPYNNNNLTFNFIGVHMQSRNHIKYQYKLEGIDPDWSSITNRTEAPYGNLPSGDYIFKIKAMNQSGIWSEPFEYKFTVRAPWWQTWWFRVLVGLIIIGIIFYFIKSREKKLIAEKEKLEKTVEERTEELVQKNILVEQQKHLVEEKHKEITDSINYAERIQRALLASKKMLDENLSDYFIFFKPKDVVSGDFYWATKLNNNNFVLVTADSTGHGVPGAIMSIVNIASLKEASLQGITSPNLLLNETRRLVIENLKNDGSAEGGKDGMDGSLLSFDLKNNELSCASANNPVWIIRSSTGSATRELIEIKADRFPIGKHDKDNIPFTLHTLYLQKGDVVYTLTDGFPDQFGGANGKKFKQKQLQNLLLEMANEPMETQNQKLNDAFDNWKGNLEQVDDVCLIGMRI
jgi:ligand-binding sensor domain-containing protein/serine phosphatase RsbU (regulator of sigma subunit)